MAIFIRMAKKSGIMVAAEQKCTIWKNKKKILLLTELPCLLLREVKKPFSIKEDRSMWPTYLPAVLIWVMQSIFPIWRLRWIIRKNGHRYSMRHGVLTGMVSMWRTCMVWTGKRSKKNMPFFFLTWRLVWIWIMWSVKWSANWTAAMPTWILVKQIVRSVCRPVC